MTAKRLRNGIGCSDDIPDEDVEEFFRLFGRESEKTVKDYPEQVDPNTFPSSAADAEVSAVRKRLLIQCCRALESGGAFPTEARGWWNRYQALEKQRSDQSEFWDKQRRRKEIAQAKDTLRKHGLMAHP